MDNSYDDEHWSSSSSSSSDSQGGDHDIDGSRSSDSYDDGWRNWALTYIIGYYSGSIRVARATTTAANLKKLSRQQRRQPVESIEKDARDS